MCTRTYLCKNGLTDHGNMYNVRGANLDEGRRELSVRFNVYNVMRIIHICTSTLYNMYIMCTEYVIYVIHLPAAAVGVRSSRPIERSHAGRGPYANSSGRQLPLSRNLNKLDLRATHARDFLIAATHHHINTIHCYLIVLNNQRSYIYTYMYIYI